MSDFGVYKLYTLILSNWLLMFCIILFLSNKNLLLKHSIYICAVNTAVNFIYDKKYLCYFYFFYVLHCFWTERFRQAAAAGIRLPLQ